MAVTTPIMGRHIDLYSAEETDAEFTLNIRKNPRFVQFLPKLDINVAEQMAWIQKQRQMEGDYFFIIKSKIGESIGTISLYNYKDGHMESGRFTIIGNPLQTYEALYLLFEFGFYSLNLIEVNAYSYTSNVREIKFSESFGCIHGEPYEFGGHSVRSMVLTKRDYENAKSRIERFLYR